MEGYAALLSGVKNNPPPVGHGDAGGDVRVEEQLFNGDDVGPELSDQVLHVRAELVEAAAEGQARRGGDGPVGHHMYRRFFGLAQAEADGGKARVYP